MERRKGIELLKAPQYDIIPLDGSNCIRLLLLSDQLGFCRALKISCASLLDDPDHQTLRSLFRSIIPLFDTY
jgi:hypothetical protein